MQSEMPSFMFTPSDEGMLSVSVAWGIAEDPSLTRHALSELNKRLRAHMIELGDSNPSRFNFMTAPFHQLPGYFTLTTRAEAENDAQLLEGFFSKIDWKEFSQKINRPVFDLNAAKSCIDVHQSRTEVADPSFSNLRIDLCFPIREKAGMNDIMREEMFKLIQKSIAALLETQNLPLEISEHVQKTKSHCYPSQMLRISLQKKEGCEIAKEDFNHLLFALEEMMNIFSGEYQPGAEPPPIYDSNRKPIPSPFANFDGPRNPMRFLEPRDARRCAIKANGTTDFTSVVAGVSQSEGARVKRPTTPSK